MLIRAVLMNLHSFLNTGDPNQIKTVWDETLAWLAPAAAAKDGSGSPVVV